MRPIVYFRCLFQFILVILIFSCQKAPKEVERILDLAGDNRTELQAVIKRYCEPKDSLKLQAAYFLITNMENKYTLSGDGLNAYKPLFDSLQHIANMPNHSPFLWINHDRRKNKAKLVWESLSNSVGSIQNNLVTLSDVHYIKANYLIENIEYAFKAWALPWSRHLSFEEFCEFVLPYRFYNEELAGWRKYFFENTDFTKLEGVTDPVVACRIINDQLSEWFQFNDLFYSYPRALNHEEILKGKMGSCREQTGLSIYAMRAIGVPVAHEYIYKWATRPIGHNFSSVRDKEGKHIKFLGGECNPGEYVINDRISKIFRKTYKYQKLLHLKETDEFIPEYFKRYDIADITREFTPVVDIKVHTKGIENDHVFLCTFDNSKWMPIAIAIKNESEAIFQNMGLGVVYLPAILYNNQLIKPVGNPILVGEDGTLKEIKLPGSKLDSLVLYRKYPLQKRHIDRSVNLIGGRFQASNDKDFENTIDLFVVKKQPTPPFDFVTRRFDTNVHEQYRYVRYLLPPIIDEGCNIADLSFYSVDNLKLEGMRYGSKWVNENHLDIAFNGNLGDYLIALNGDTNMGMIKHVIFIEDTVDCSNIWLAMDLGKKQIIKQVGLTPRSDTNNIYYDCTYELLYWNNQWISLGQRTGFEDKLTYKNVPEGALFWLRNLTRGSEERIFIYKNGIQEFY